MNGKLATDWSQLQLLVEVAREGSLLGAARIHGLSVSTLSRRMTRLEKGLGRSLFDRGPRGAVMNPAGAALAAVAESFEQQLSGTVRALPAPGRALSGTIRVSAGDGFASLIAETMAEFSRSHPKVTFELALDARVIDLARRDADVALRTTQRNEASLVYRKLGELSFGLFASPALLRRLGAPKRPSDLRPWPSVLLAPPLDRLPTEVWLAERTRVAVRSTSFTGQHAAVIAGAGVACLPLASTGGLERLLKAQRFQSIPLWLVTRASSREEPQVQAFSALLRSRAESLLAESQR